MSLTEGGQSILFSQSRHDMLRSAGFLIDAWVFRYIMLPCIMAE